jgi:hypothetical protein
MGPGSFLSLMFLAGYENQIFGFDPIRKQIQEYKADGKFLRTIKAPASAFDFKSPAKKVKEGWVFLSPDKQSVILCDESFSPLETLIGTFQGDPFEEEPVEPLGVSRVRKFNPAPESALFLIIPQTDQLLLYEPGAGFRISVYDLLERKVITQIEQSISPTPFNEDWGENLLSDMKERSRLSGRNVTWEADFPKFFPQILKITSDPNGAIRCLPGLKYLNQNIPTLVFDLKGREVQSKFSDADIRRIVAVQNNWAYVSVYKETEVGDKEFGLLRLKVDEVAAYLKENPSTGFAN